MIRPLSMGESLDQALGTAWDGDGAGDSPERAGDVEC